MLDFFDYAGVQRSFNVRVLAPDIWIGNFPRALDRFVKSFVETTSHELTDAIQPPATPIYDLIPPPGEEEVEPVLPQEHTLDLSDAPPHVEQFIAFTQNVPEVLKSEKRWSVWQKRDDGRKIPLCVLESGFWSRTKRCKSNVPEMWVSFDEAIACLRNSNGHLGGLAFALGDDWMGFDFDDVIVDGEMHPLAKSWLARLGGYAEVSQSGKGKKNILRGRLNAEFLGTAETGRQFKGVPAEGMATEVYHERRFFFLTGNGSGEPTANQREIDAICSELTDWKARRTERLKPKPKPKQQPPLTETNRLSDTEILEKIRASKQATKFDSLWNGHIPYDSPSEADLALTAILMWWCGNDKAQVERLFQQSALAMRDKWDRDDYRERTLAKAERSETYSPRQLSQEQSNALKRLAERRARRQAEVIA